MSVYAVHWPAINVVKVGTSERRMKRWRAFMNRGANLLALVDEIPGGVSDYWFEDACHLVMDETFRRAFRSAAEAVPYLGGQGGGWCECYRVAGDLMASEILPFIDSRLAVFCGEA